MSRSNGGWPHLPLEAMSDIELLLVFEEAMDGDGGATSIAVAEKTGEGIRAARAIGGRFAWLKRWGYLEQDERTRKWYLTPEGESLRRGVSLKASDTNAAARLADKPLAAGVALATFLGHDGLRMLRRQMRYQEVAG